MTPGTEAHQASLSFTVSWSLLKLMSTESVMPSNISSSAAPFSFCLQSCPASGSFLKNWWPKYWSFSFSISPSNEYPGLISFRMDWFVSLLSKGLSRISRTHSWFMSLILPQFSNSGLDQDHSYLVHFLLTSFFISSFFI